jgi:molybdopterin converting factor small subunit
MRISMTYFAQIRRAAGGDTETLELPAGATAADALSAAAAGHSADFRALTLAPDGAPHANLIVLVNDQPAARGRPAPLRDGDRISLFSPVAGG